MTSWTEDEYLYVATAGEVQRFQGLMSAAPGAFIDIFVSEESSSLLLAKELQFRPDGILYVVSGGTAEVFRYDGTIGDFIDTTNDDINGALRSCTRDGKCPFLNTIRPILARRSD